MRISHRKVELPTRPRRPARRAVGIGWAGAGRGRIVDHLMGKTKDGAS